jgi:hypothetical protein
VEVEVVVEVVVVEVEVVEVVDEVEEVEVAEVLPVGEEIAGGVAEAFGGRRLALKRFIAG